MWWRLIAGIFVIGCILSFVGTLYVARDVLQEVDEMSQILPSEDLSHAMDILDEAE